MSNLESNLNQFISQYDFKKRNYNIIIHSPNATGKYSFVNHLVKKYYESNDIAYSDNLMSGSDIFYLSLPLYNKSGKFERMISNKERILYELGFEDKFDNCRVGSDIAIEHIRDLKEFTNITPRYKHKFIIINNCNYLNTQSSAALLKTLEETNSPCIFLLLASEVELIKDTVKSRCHLFRYHINETKNIYDSHFDFYLSSKPSLKEMNKEYEYLNNYKLFEAELSDLYENKINPINLSKDWVARGYLCIDYLLSLFYILMKGSFLDDDSSIKRIYVTLSKKIPINSLRATHIIRILQKMKVDMRGNLNKKLFYDNLLIVLNKELY